ncbi:MAG: ribosome hibernation-promoting factor, HPF/YfiA family [Bacilli bacterium]|jgi:putative sigma-54 modulation protein
MQYNIHGDKIAITEAIKNYIISKLSKLDKYLKNNENIIARIIVRIVGHEQKIEVTIPIKSITLRAEESHSDLYSAIDLVVEKLERQIRKNKTRLQFKFAKEAVIDFTNIDDDNGDEEHTIIRRKRLELKPMDEEEAILEMNLLNHDFFVFKDRDIEKVCILYRRKDGNYGIIET